MRVRTTCDTTAQAALAAELVASQNRVQGACSASDDARPEMCGAEGSDAPLVLISSVRRQGHVSAGLRLSSAGNIESGQDVNSCTLIS